MEPMESQIASADTIKSVVSKGLSLIQIENENMRQLALAKPRNLAEIYKDVLTELDLVPEFASKSFYSIPYKNDMGGTTYVEGPSIKAAMSLASRWGNCSNSGRIVEENDDRLIVEGVFTDYERAFQTTRQVSVTRMAWNKAIKKVVPLRDDRLNLAIQAGLSKATRNAILASLPVSLVEAYMRKAKELSAQSVGMKSSSAKPAPKKIQTFQERIDNAQAMFIKLGVTPEQWKDYMDGSSLAGDDLLAHLVGLYNSLTEGQSTIDAVFGASKQQPDQGQIKSHEVFNAKS